MKDGGCRALFLPQRTPDQALTDMHGLYGQKNKQHTRPCWGHPPVAVENAEDNRGAPPRHALRSPFETFILPSVSTAVLLPPPALRAPLRPSALRLVCGRLAFLPSTLSCWQRCNLLDH